MWPLESPLDVVTSNDVEAASEDPGGVNPVPEAMGALRRGLGCWGPGVQSLPFILIPALYLQLLSVWPLRLKRFKVAPTKKGQHSLSTKHEMQEIHIYTFKTV